MAAGRAPGCAARTHGSFLRRIRLEDRDALAVIPHYESGVPRPPGAPWKLLITNMTTLGTPASSPELRRGTGAQRGQLGSVGEVEADRWLA